MIMVMMMTSIYFNYLMKPCEANRCRAGTISRSLKDPRSLAPESQHSAARQKNGCFSALSSRYTQSNFWLLNQSGGGQRWALWRANDLWLLVGCKAVIARPLCFHGTYLKLSFLIWIFSLGRFRRSGVIVSDINWLIVTLGMVCTWLYQPCL